MSFFQNLVKGTSSGAAGTGSFTPSAAAAGFLAWTEVPVGWIGLVRYEDGTAWELRYGFWNGTTITRPSNIVASSTGSALTLSSSATAAFVADGRKLMMISGGEKVVIVTPTIGQITWQVRGTTGSPPVAGTPTAGTMSNAAVLTEQTRVTYTGATTANQAAGIRIDNIGRFGNSNVTRGVAEFQTRFGATSIPTSARLAIVLSDNTFGLNSSTEQPSTTLYNNFFGLCKDASDTNMQFMMAPSRITATPAAVKIDTGLPLVVNGWYELHCTAQPGRFTFLLVRIDTGEIVYATTAGLAYTAPQSDQNASFYHQLTTGTVTGTGATFHIGETYIRLGL